MQKKNSTMAEANTEMKATEILFGGIMATASLWAIWCTVSLLFVAIS